MTRLTGRSIVPHYTLHIYTNCMCLSQKKRVLPCRPLFICNTLQNRLIKKYSYYPTTSETGHIRSKSWMIFAFSSMSHTHFLHSNIARLTGRVGAPQK